VLLMPAADSSKADASGAKCTGEHSRTDTHEPEAVRPWHRNHRPRSI